MATALPSALLTPCLGWQAGQHAFEHLPLSQGTGRVKERGRAARRLTDASENGQEEAGRRIACTTLPKSAHLQPLSERGERESCAAATKVLRDAKSAGKGIDCLE